MSKVEKTWDEIKEEFMKEISAEEELLSKIESAVEYALSTAISYNIKYDYNVFVDKNGDFIVHIIIYDASPDAIAGFREFDTYMDFFNISVNDRMYRIMRHVIEAMYRIKHETITVIDITRFEEYIARRLYEHTRMLKRM
jgi:hypothetical protein